MKAFLPVTYEEMKGRGWDRPDFVYISGDAYVDHSSFGAAIITRLLEHFGYRVCVIAQPDWKRKESVTVFGEPALGFLVSSGNMDSMVNHYSVSLKKRKRDAYSPGGVSGLRPDRAVTVYANLIRQTYKKTPIILGGIEASLRRLGHYDYWSDSMKRSILLDSGADLISYGMGERSILEIAEGLSSGLPIEALTFIPGTVYRSKSLPEGVSLTELPPFERIREDRSLYAKSFGIQYKNTDPYTAFVLSESYGERGYVIQNPPARPLSEQEMDDVYALPFTGRAHPSYDAKGGVPALSEVRFSLTSSRGCFGGCSFCALTFHEGRIVQTRSHESILAEAREMTKDPLFKGYIHDVGGPTANFRHPSCEKQLKAGVCREKQCLFPKPCKNLTVDHTDYLRLLRSLRSLPGVKKVFIRSGIRFDYLLADPDPSFFRELVRHHVSGQLRVAPEHICEEVLSLMGKPSFSVYQRFLKEFDRLNKEEGLSQYALPYFISSHPGSTMKEAVRLAEYIRDLGFTPEQVQDFYPTPSTLSTVMYCSGIHPLTGKKVYVPKSPHEKALQRALLQVKKPENREKVLEALKLAHREDLIGYGKNCLIRPDAPRGDGGKKKRAGDLRKKQEAGKAEKFAHSARRGQRKREKT